MVSRLTEVYCGDIGIEFMHITDVYEREWIIKYWEELSNEFKVDDKLKHRMAELMIKCESFDEFMALKFPSVKRYGAEGAESMLVFFDEIFRQAANTNPSALNRDHYSNKNEIKSTVVPPNKDTLGLNKQITDIIIGMPHR